MRVLFVCGYNARPRSATYYDAVVGHFAARGDAVDFFRYTRKESAVSVYARLCGVCGSFDALVAYSMGATLVARYLTCHADAAAAYSRVVLCMPLLAPNPTLSALMSSLVPHGACSLWQFVHVYRRLLDRADEIDAVALLERPNVHVLYALRETLTPIPWRVLSRAANLHVVHGGHAAFETPAQFFAALDAALP